jgi:hypothetical protein
MQKIITVLIGLSLLMFGVMTLAANLILPALGVRFTWLEPWRYWPMIVLGIGSLLFMLGLLSIRRAGWGALFIPAIPINVTGGLLLIGSVFNYWHIWSFGWSFIILGLAVGFLFAAVSTRIVWFVIPAILVGANGLALAFCSITGLWHWWSFLWIIEPLAVGLVLLLVAFKTRSPVVTIVGASFCAFAIVTGLMMVGVVMVGNWGFRMMFPALLIFLGCLLLAWGASRNPQFRLNQ